MINEIEIELEIDEGNRYDVESDQVIIVKHTDLPVYGGPYEVTPRLDAQILETEQTAMEHDITVHGIPITRTTNIYDGITVLIG